MTKITVMGSLQTPTTNRLLQLHNPGNTKTMNTVTHSSQHTTVTNTKPLFPFIPLLCTCKTQLHIAIVHLNTKMSVHTKNFKNTHALT